MRTDKRVGGTTAAGALLDEVLCCPSCGGSITSGDTCSRCGIQFRMTEGILDMLLPAERSEIEAFITEYNLIRRAQRWEVRDPEALPFERGRGSAYWKLRRRSFEIIRAECAAQPAAGAVALDLGAGFGWLTRHLTDWGYCAVAVDVNVAAPLGLRGADVYLKGGRKFERLRASLDRLPFRPESADLVILNASLTYARDPDRVIREVHEILRPAGGLIVADTPIYTTQRGGERMSERLYWQHRRMLGRAPIYHHRFTYVLKDALFDSLKSAGFSVDVRETAKDWWWRLYVLRNRLRRSEPVWMPVLIARKSSGGK